jgi:hypothetical protein
MCPLTLSFPQCSSCVLILDLLYSCRTMLFPMIFIQLLACVLCLVSHCIAYRSYVQARSCFPRQLSSVAFSWFSHVHSVSCARVPEFLSSVTLLPVTRKIFKDLLYPCVLLFIRIHLNTLIKQCI